MKKIYLIIATCLFSSIIYAQDSAEKEREKIDSLFSSEMSRDDFRDTNMVYMFAFKVQVSRNKKGNVKIFSISVSDSSAYRIYKNFDFLREINYKLFMNKSNRSTFIFPVGIFLEYPDKKHTGFINMQDLQKKMELYWFRHDYYHEPTDEYIYIPTSIHRTSTVSDY